MRRPVGVRMQFLDDPRGGERLWRLLSGNNRPSETTHGDSLGWLSWGIPALLVAGLAAGVASPGIRLIAQPDHPVRRGIVAGGSYLAALLRRGRRRNG